MHSIINNSSEHFPPAGHYSHSTTAGGLVWISGQLPVTKSGERLAAAPFEDQARQVLSNLDACLLGAGVNRSKLVNVRIYITDMNEWPVFNKVYAEWIGEHRPARAVAGVAELHYGAAVEVEAVALAPQA
ncbi:RidA family protein (plasmid) [Pantoea agglomerans]|uniref:RidA family protein n=1 Tax=Enterobacter agglomerans TaxID=549 RepID=UPI0013CA5801|nr:RidA family protein [Pantoea agglomerans]NEG64663.1 RidA family protein [Pantoea agglomerans]